LRCQTERNQLADSLLNQLAWKLSNQELNPLQWLNYFRTLMEWYNGRKMDAYIDKELDKRFKVYQQGTTVAQGKFESIIDLALQDYMAGDGAAAKKLDQRFRIIARRNIRMLLFSGHDSTGSTISYCHYLLHKNPTTLARLRAEHDSVLGKDISKASTTLCDDPHLLNKLPYTAAVIKETLRLFPPAASIREGVEGVDLIDEEGNHYPTGKCMIYILHSTIHRDTTNFVRAEEFLPERWLVDAEDPLCPTVKGAWRAFEYGPRNCIAQLSVMLQIKVVLAATVREFDVKPAYEEWDTLNPKKGLRVVEGERAYQIDEGAAHPADHFPCRVFFRDSE
jgi:cytochrome P450